MEKPYYHTQVSVDEYIRLAQGVNGGNLITLLQQHLPAGARVLELGSGPGTDWEILSRTYEVVGSDFSPVFVTHLKNTYPDGSFVILDAAILTIDQVFNGIYSNKVFHHLSDEQLYTSLARQYEILDDDGIVCHSFWKGEGSEIFKGMLVNYHTASELRKIFDKYGFELLVLESYEEFEADDSLVMVARKRGFLI